jgi:retron-type reverse transcriptase
MNSKEWAARNLAAKLSASGWQADTLTEAVDPALSRRSMHGRDRLIDRLAELYRAAYPPSPEQLVVCLLASPAFRPKLRMPRRAVLDPPRFAPSLALAHLVLPPLATPGELGAWLGLSIEQLDWLADRRRAHRRSISTPLQHYRYAFVPKASGPPRLIEAPKPRLKAIQRRILDEILGKVPVHPAAHGFVAGRSAVTNAQLHAGEAVILGLDLKSFFPTLRMARIHGIFRTLGYPWAVARLLTGLCSTEAPPALFAELPKESRPDWALQALYCSRHLPQGAPTSPCLANLAAWQLDRRLDGLANAVGARYTRYADDLSFSGDDSVAARVPSLQRAVEQIVGDEGFVINAAKTRIMRDGQRQQVTGIVVNAHCNLARDEFDRLKAILHNCVAQGPASQNRAGHPDFRRHLDGRIAWAEQLNPRRGAKLRASFDRIEWQ